MVKTPGWLTLTNIRKRRAIVLVPETERIADRIEDRRRLSQRVIEVARHVDHERSVNRPPIEEAVAAAPAQAVAWKRKSQLRLRGVQSVIDSPVDAGVARLGDSVEALELQRRTVELLFAHKRDRGRERLKRLAEHEVRVFLVQAGLEPRIGRIKEGVGILASDLDRFPANEAGMASVGEIGSILESIVEPRAAFDTVVARELVPGEQVRIVENEALRVFVGQPSDRGLVVGR